MASILVLHGPNLNLLGSREPEIYGSDTLADINLRLQQQCTDTGLSFEQFQSNGEEGLINRIHQARLDGCDFIIINPGGFTHTSVALRDAMLATQIPFIEVHLSNLYRREEFRRKSYFSDIAVGSIVGLGALGYELALQAASKQLSGN